MKLDASLEERLKVTKFSEDGKLFLRAFLIDATINQNDWGVVSASIPKNIHSAIGMPLTLDEEYDHPKWQSNKEWSAQEEFRRNFQYQQKYAIGVIRDVVQKDGRWDALIEITDPIAKAAIENEDIPFFVSPRILHDPNEPEDAIEKWMLFHLAIVDKPAFGDKAKVSSACYGEAAQCQVALKNAKKEDCGFCVKTALQKLVTNHDSSHSSLNLDGKKNLLMGDSTAPINPPVDLSNYVPKGDYEALKTEVGTYKQANADLKKSFDEFKASIEEENRKQKITSVLSAKIADEKVRAERIKYFLDAKAAPEIVETAYKDFPDIAVAKADNESTFTGKSADAKANGGWMDNFYKVQSQVIKGARA